MNIRDGTIHTNSHWKQDGKPIILIDFDHTITKKCLACDDGLKNDSVQEDAVRAIRRLSWNFRIWIYTGNQDHADFAKGLQRSKEDIETFLKIHDIPFEKVLQTKPPACFIIDDRAIHHKSWKETLRQVKQRKKETRT